MSFVDCNYKQILETGGAYELAINLLWPKFISIINKVKVGRSDELKIHLV